MPDQEGINRSMLVAWKRDSKFGADDVVDEGMFRPFRYALVCLFCSIQSGKRCDEAIN